jgi:hypothetical protein
MVELEALLNVLVWSQCVEHEVNLGEVVEQEAPLFV